MRTEKRLKGQAQRVVVDNRAENASASLQMIQNWEQWLICLRVVLPSRGTLTAWRNLKKFNKRNCKFLCLKRDNLSSSCVSVSWGQSAGKPICRRGSGDADRHQDALVASRTSSILVYIRRSIAGRSREGIFLPYSALVRPQPQCCPVLGSPVPQEKYWRESSKEP